MGVTFAIIAACGLAGQRYAASGAWGFYMDVFSLCQRDCSAGAIREKFHDLRLTFVGRF
jgi:hypothetical protein